MLTRVLSLGSALALALAAYLVPVSGPGPDGAATPPPRAPAVTRVHLEIPALPLETMASLATGIVRARVRSLRAAESADGTVATEVGLDVLSTIAGPGRPRLLVRMAGGAAGYRRLEVDAAPVLAPGDEIVAFLCGGEAGEDTGFLGLRHGVLRVAGRAGAETVSGALASDERLDAFADRIRTIVREGR